jgi:Ser/Thr protein kinase RdoA (MazF antagonist)
VLKIVDDDALEGLLGRLAALHEAGFPVPRLRRTLDGHWSDTPFPPAKDRAYVMGHLPGAPAPRWSTLHADATAALLARPHAWGTTYVPRSGNIGGFAAQRCDAYDAAGGLAASGLVPEPVVSAAIERLAGVRLDRPLPKTHIHGDARICHFLFIGETLSGLIDHDLGGWGERLTDIAYHAISHPDAARVALLDGHAILDWVKRYHALNSLDEAERELLPAALACALLVELDGSRANFEAGQSSVGEQDILRGENLLKQLPTAF